MVEVLLRVPWDEAEREKSRMRTRTEVSHTDYILLLALYARCFFIPQT
jgi:hypothetical protein